MELLLVSPIVSESLGVSRRPGSSVGRALESLGKRAVAERVKAWDRFPETLRRSMFALRRSAGN